MQHYEYYQVPTQIFCIPNEYCQDDFYILKKSIPVLLIWYTNNSTSIRYHTMSKYVYLKINNPWHPNNIFIFMESKKNNLFQNIFYSYLQKQYIKIVYFAGNIDIFP